ncbi:hypothetical protein C7447_1011058 [Tenacibaculum adriaticum]|uniref:Uncharacterized protein n=1 Tax=Tenacibaculum adriaticum TaxID=413713 RepID=A0A5S5DX67_9FLAO|nr:hypothetical protein C7447_1011058 [Tenacibaculum adriaticum]
MSKQFPTYEVLSNTAKTEKLTLLQKFAFWFRDFLENAE